MDDFGPDILDLYGADPDKARSQAAVLAAAMLAGADGGAWAGGTRGAPGGAAALLTRISIPPNFATVAADNRARGLFLQIFRNTGKTGYFCVDLVDLFGRQNVAATFLFDFCKAFVILLFEFFELVRMLDLDMHGHTANGYFILAGWAYYV